MLYYLQLIKEGYDAYEIEKKGTKFFVIWTTMVRKGLVSEGKLTLQGEDLFSFLSSEIETPKLSRKKFTDEPFDIWWKAYPPTDTFEYNNRKFKGTRALRVKKDDCKAKLNKILNSGEYILDELVEALKLEIEQKAEASFKEGKNKMSYFQNSLTYLNQATYDPYVELVRAGHKAEEPSESINTDVEI